MTMDETARQRLRGVLLFFQAFARIRAHHLGRPLDTENWLLLNGIRTSVAGTTVKELLRRCPGVTEERVISRLKALEQNLQFIEVRQQTNEKGKKYLCVYPTKKFIDAFDRHLAEAAHLLKTHFLNNEEQKVTCLDEPPAAYSVQAVLNFLLPWKEYGNSWITFVNHIFEGAPDTARLHRLRDRFLSDEVNWFIVMSFALAELVLNRPDRYVEFNELINFYNDFTTAPGSKVRDELKEYRDLRVVLDPKTTSRGAALQYRLRQDISSAVIAHLVTADQIFKEAALRVDRR